ncbi:MAG: glyoxalase [Pedobacter sp.]|jgi:uncharacterized glyoxalase superfamily protein PhnB|nr:glyoxalase [Pedobacter sp.]
MSLSPNIYVENVQTSIEFYQQLGFSVVMVVPEDGVNPVWAMMQREEVTIMFESFSNIEGRLPQIKRTSGGSLLFYVKVKDVEQYFESIKAKVNVIHPLQKTFYGATEFSIEDCNGFVITFAD